MLANLPYNAFTMYL